jgi:hypothetical protein
MPRPRTFRRSKKNYENIIGGIIIIIFVIVIIALFYTYYLVNSRTVKIDKNTFCPDPPAQITVVLIDRSDKLNVAQQMAIRINLNDIRETIPKGGEFSLYSVNSTRNALLQNEFKICNPGRRENIDPLIGNPSIAERRWKTGFAEPLKKVLDSMLEPNIASESPIMESIQSVALTAFSGKKLENVPKRLIIVSDMLHKTSEFSCYSGKLDFTSFKNTRYFRKIRSGLDGVRVSIFYIRRETKRSVQGRKHIEFWQNFFLEQGAIVDYVKTIEG